MKKFFGILFGLMLAVSFAKADQIAVLKDTGTGALNIKSFALGRYPGQTSAYLAVPMTAQAAITVGMPVKINSDTSVWTNTVSKTAAATDQQVIGIATNTCAAGDTCYVALSGIVNARFPASMTVTAGVAYCGTTSGDLTPTSTVSGTTNTTRAISIVYVLETRAVGPDGLARCVIVH